MRSDYIGGKYTEEDLVERVNSNIYVEILSISKIQGGAIKDVAMGLLLLFKDLNSYFSVKAIVLDTNIILNELNRICLKREPTTLISEAKSDFVRLFVSSCVYDEVLEKIPDYAKRRHGDSEQYRMVWEEYKKNLYVIDPGNLTSEKIKLLKNRDSDDVPTAQLIELIAPTLALSDDKDLNGYAQQGKWLPYVLNTRSVVEKDVMNIIFTIGAGTVIVGLKDGLSCIFNLISSLFKRTPKHVLYALVLFSVPFILSKKSRKWIKNKIENILSSDIKDIQKGLKPLLNMSLEKIQKWTEAEKYINSGKPEHSAILSLKGYAIRILAHSYCPLTSEEILNGATQLGYRPRGNKSDQYLRRILRKEPIFTEEEKGRWKLSILNNN